MDFKKKYEYLECDLLEVEIHDLSNEKEFRRKLFLTDEDMRLTFDKETLKENKIIIPIIKNQPILPLQLHAKYADFEYINHGGGVIEIIQHIGKEKLNPRDKRYRTPVAELDENGRRKEPNRFYFYYDHGEKRYVNIKDEEKWKEKLEWINGIKESDDIQNVIWNFFDFYEDYFLSGKYIDDKCRTGEINEKTNSYVTKTITYRHYLDVVEELEINIPVLEDYLYLSLAFGDIERLTYDHGLEQIENLKDVIKTTKKLILEKFGDMLDHDYSATADLLDTGGRTSRSDFKEAVEPILQPAVFYHPEIDSFIPNLGQLYNRLQPSEKFENENSIFERYAEQIENIKTASAVSGKFINKPIWL